MEASGTKIKLKQLTESDWPIFKELYTNPRTMKHVYNPFDEDVAWTVFNCRLKPWDINSDGWLSFSINELSTKATLGLIGLKITNHTAKIAEVGFMLLENARGKGIASEALTILVKFAFTELGLNKLIAMCSTENSGSYNLLEKRGFIREGCLAQNSFINNQYVDDYIYGLCKSTLNSQTP
ncbi:GNAT family N-acetyltransferase [Vibrio mangrovi]|uniref:GNAT family protein n=1 Tax=Vibrio mangrovi TaxID=474394 RepID=A0A1Y6J2N8_9VIBR|nr:GNAT family protein [Vibrio mangrovi]MDW6005106.1 GNAT family protein [Vibrio mangrovi]SMS02972.1 Ribosomal-protein-serine acetyltransferase [Vibrio mangrovi]